MSVRRRIIITLTAMNSLVAVILLLFIGLNTDRVRRSGDDLLGDVDSDVRINVEHELLTLAQKIGNYTLTLEAEIENNMRNAANAVFEADRLSGFSLTEADLYRLKDRTGMSDLYISGTDGIFTLSTEPGGAGVSLFDIWDGYRMLVTGEADFMTSDLSMKVETGEVFKFALIPRADGMGIIESALEAGAVETYLQEYIESGHGIRSMNLFDANQLTLTENYAQGMTPEYTKGSTVPQRAMSLNMYFDGAAEYSIVFDDEKAQIYYAVFDGARVRYVLYIDLDTAGYFNLKDRIGDAMESQVEQTSLFNTISLVIVLAVLIVFMIIIITMVNRVMLNYEEQNMLIEQRNRTVLDIENLVKYHTIIMLCVGLFFAIVQGLQYGAFAATVIICSVVILSLFMFITRRLIPLGIRVHIISNGSFFVAFICSAAITSTPDMFGLFLACVIVGTLYFKKSVILVMAVIVNATIVIGIFLLKLGLPDGYEITSLWFFNNIAGLNCGIALLYAVSSIGKGFIENITFKSRETEQLLEKVQQQNDTIISGLDYAGNIQRNLLPPENDMAQAFSDYSVIWKPRDIVGGDIYWIRRFESGTVLCVADCTGHGTPGALLTMLVVSAMESIIRTTNCGDTAEIIMRLDKRISSVLHVNKYSSRGNDGGAAEGMAGTEHLQSNDSHPLMHIDDGCDIAVLFIANDGSVRFSSGNISVFVCDGRSVTQYKGQKIFVGEGKIKSKDEVDVHNIPAGGGSAGAGGNKFYIASDGLFDQLGSGHTGQFGYSRFKEIILKSHSEKQAVITSRVWEVFEEYRGDEPQRDDFELVAFRP